MQSQDAARPVPSIPCMHEPCNGAWACSMLGNSAKAWLGPHSKCGRSYCCCCCVCAADLGDLDVCHPVCLEVCPDQQEVDLQGQGRHDTGACMLLTRARVLRLQRSGGGSDTGVARVRGGFRGVFIAR